MAVILPARDLARRFEDKVWMIRFEMYISLTTGFANSVERPALPSDNLLFPSHFFLPLTGWLAIAWADCARLKKDTIIQSLPLDWLHHQPSTTYPPHLSSLACNQIRGNFHALSPVAAPVPQVPTYPVPRRTEN